MEIYGYFDTIPLSYTRVNLGVIVTGLAVTVTVKNAVTGATLLASTSCPEVGAPSGIYTYNWTHGITAQTECLVSYLAGGVTYSEYILITNSNTGSRTA